MIGLCSPISFIRIHIWWSYICIFAYVIWDLVDAPSIHQTQGRKNWWPSWKTAFNLTTSRWREWNTRWSEPVQRKGWSWQVAASRLGVSSVHMNRRVSTDSKQCECLSAWWLAACAKRSGVGQKRVGQLALGSWVVVFWLEVSAWGWLRWCFPCSLSFDSTNNFQDGWQPQRQQQQTQPKHHNNKSKHVKSRTSSFESGLLWLSELSQHSERCWRPYPVIVLRTNDESSHGEGHSHSIAKGMPTGTVLFYQHT